MAVIGYARISTPDQLLDLQHDALTKASCQRIFTDTASGASSVRPGLTQALATLERGDTLAVWRLDRLGRLAHLIETVEALRRRGISFISLSEGFDTGTPAGEMLFHVIGAMAQMERTLIRERTVAGLAAAKSRGRIGGRPRRLTTAQLDLAQRLLAEPKASMKRVAALLGVARSTLYANLALLASDQAEQSDTSFRTPAAAESLEPEKRPSNGRFSITEAAQ